MSHFASILAALVSDATTVGRNVLKAVDKAAGRSAIDAETVGAAAAAQTAAATDATTKASAAQAAAIAASVPTGRLVSGRSLAGDITTANLAADLGLGLPTQIATGASLTWTTVNGSIAGGSSTAVSGTITLTHNASLTSGWYAGAYTGPSARATFAPTRGDRWRIQARLGTGSNLNVGSRLGFGLYIDATTNRLIHAIPTNSIISSHNTGGANYNPTSKVDASVAANATTWVRITRLGSIITYEYGYSTGTTPPTTWAAIWTETLATVAPTAGTVTLDSRGDWTGIGYTLVCNFWQPLSAPASAPVCVVDTITVWDL